MCHQRLRNKWNNTDHITNDKIEIGSERIFQIMISKSDKFLFWKYNSGVPECYSDWFISGLWWRSICSTLSREI